MFHNENIMNNEQLKPAWKAAHNLLDKDSVGEVCLPKVCDTLNAWVDSKHHTTRKRLSLRTSATLVNGAARLYKMGLDELFNDIIKLEKEILNRNRRSPINIQEPSETTEEEEEESEQPTSETRKSSTEDSDERIAQSTAEGESMAMVFSEGASVGQSKETTEVEDNEFERDDSIENIRLALETSELRHGESSGQMHGELPRRNEIGTQTSTSGRYGPTQFAGFDENLPFGFTLIYDTPGARVPFKLTMSSFNPNVRKL